MIDANFLPLAIALLAVAPFALASVHPPTDRLVTRLSVGLLGRYVGAFRSEHPARQQALRAAHVGHTYREYGARSFVFAAVFAVAGSVVGIYVGWGVLYVLAIDPEVLAAALPSSLSFLASLGGIPALSPGELFVLFVLSATTVGVMAGGITYWLRWWYPAHRAATRGRRIEATLPATVAFCHALSRSGMGFQTAVRTVAENDDVYGAAAAEFDVAVGQMDVFGADVATALRTGGRRSASQEFREFTENLVSVLQSGQDLSAFLERQYHDYREEAESQQERVLDLLGTLAEAYVTVLVAGPLFLITILVVIGFSVADTLTPLRVLVYLVLPLGNLAFVVYLATVSSSFAPGGSGSIDSVVASTPGTTSNRGRTDGGTAPTSEAPSPAVRRRLDVYGRLETLATHLWHPRRTLLDRPARILLVTGPIALAALAWHLPVVHEDGLAAIDDVLVVVGILLLGSFAVAFELHHRRVKAIERAIPDLLDRLASVNEAGLPVVAAFERVSRSDLGVLDDDFDRIRADVEWGSDLATALRRFERRIRTRAIRRVVTLLTAAMNASGDLASVLRIAARQAIEDRRLERERTRIMTEYMVVIYVSFLVFVFIVAVLWAFLLPSVPTEAPAAAENGAVAAETGLGQLGAIDPESYRTLFSHATVIQGVLSGLVAGQLAGGDVRLGAKHAALMATVAFLLFAVVL